MAGTADIALPGREVPLVVEKERKVEPAKHDIRFDEPLYTVAEAARFLGVPPSTFSTWAKGYERRPAGRPAVRAYPLYVQPF